MDISKHDKSMSPYDIEEHRKLLVNSYKCDDDDIFIEFKKIIIDGMVDIKNITLKYKMKTVVSGEVIHRDIFTINIKIPEEVVRSYNDIKNKLCSQ